MAKSNRVSLAEVRAMVRLLGECRELGDDPVVWRQHFGAGIARMVGAELVTTGEVTGCISGMVQVPGGTAWGFENGFNLAAYRTLVEGCSQDPLGSETFRGIVAAWRGCRGPGVALARHQLVPDRLWQRTFDYQFMARTMGTDAMIQSLWTVDTKRDEVDGMALCRAPGQPAFDDREVAVVSLVHQEVARLVGGPLARFDEPAPSKLAPRVRQVLRCLLEGDGDKQVALRLGLSQHTVNQYTKLIYGYFRVGGRTELLARWVRRGWGAALNWDAANTAPTLTRLGRSK